MPTSSVQVDDAGSGDITPRDQGAASTWLWQPTCSCHLPLGRINSRRREAASFSGRANGPEVNPRGQGPRGYGSAARRLPAFEARDAGGVTPFE